MSNYYQKTAIGDNVYRLSSKEGVFLDLFVGSEKALLYDTGYGYGDLRAFVREITDLPVIVVNSHGHLDHTFGNFRFEDCEVYIHENDMELVAAHNTVEMRQSSVEYAKHSFDYFTGKTSNILPAGFDAEAYVNAGYGNPIAITEGHIFDIGGICLDTLHFRGHTKGGIALWNKKERTIYMGDAINSFIWLFMPEADPLSVYIDALKKAKTLDFDKFYCSHSLMPLLKTSLDDFLDAAENVDFDKGVPFESPFVKVESDVRICTRRGYNLEDFGKEGFSAVVIKKENLR